MADTSDLHIGDTGTIIRITITENNTAVDLSGATVKQIVFQDKTRVTVTRDADFVTDGTDGQIQVLSEEDDFQQSGELKIQVYLELSNWQGHSSIDTLSVGKNLT